MLIAYVECRPKTDGRCEVWEDVMLARLEVSAPPQLGWVVRIPLGHDGPIRRYRVREIVVDLPKAGQDRVVEQELTIYVVLVPPSGMLEAAHCGAPPFSVVGDGDGKPKAVGAGGKSR